nr:hypothetical protein [Tanacetum cinerariifolium]
MSAKRTSWNEFSSAMASAVICLAIGRTFNFSKYIFESLVRNVDSSSKFYMYPRFIHLIIQNQLGDLLTHSTKDISPALTQKVFANMRRVGKGCSRVETPLFKGMLVAIEPENKGNAKEQGAPEEQGNDNNATEEPVTAADDVADQSIQSPTPLTPPPQQPQDIPSTSQVAQDLEIIKLKTRVKKLERANKVKTMKLKRLRKVGTSHRIESSDDNLMEDVSNQGRVIDESDKDKGTKLMIEEKEKETEETPTKTKSKDKGKGIMVEEPKPIKKKQQVELDEAYARKLQEEHNQDIDWEVAMNHVKQKAKENPYVQRYQVMKKRPQTKAQAQRNMMVYLKNTAGFTLDFFKGMSYDDIPKRRRLNKEAEDVEELKQHLEIMPDEDDNVYTEATPLAWKVPVVDYQIIHVNNKPRYKIIHADDTHQLYRSFITMLKNFDREDLETLWNIVKERFSKSKPNNFSDEYLLSTLKTMFGRPDGQDSVWKDQRSVHGQALVKSWKLLTSCGVYIISFTTTQIIMLIERRYPLSKFTLEQMLNVVRL